MKVVISPWSFSTTIRALTPQLLWSPPLTGALSRGYARTYCWGPRGTLLGLVGERGGGGGTSGRRGEWRSRS